MLPFKLLCSCAPYFLSSVGLALGTVCARMTKRTSMPRTPRGISTWRTPSWLDSSRSRHSQAPMNAPSTSNNPFWSTTRLTWIGKMRRSLPTRRANSIFSTQRSGSASRWLPLPSTASRRACKVMPGNFTRGPNFKPLATFLEHGSRICLAMS